MSNFTFAFPALFSSRLPFSILQSALPSWQTGSNFDQSYSLRILACNFSPRGLMVGSWLLYLILFCVCCSTTLLFLLLRWSLPLFVYIPQSLMMPRPLKLLSESRTTQLLQVPLSAGIKTACCPGRSSRGSCSPSENAIIEVIFSVSFFKN